MNIPSAKYLKNKARNRLESGQEPQKVVLVYSGISAGLALLVTVLRYLLAGQISQTGGLQNIGMRSILSTADNVLPILETVLAMCLGLGYLAAMLRISRRQFASPKTLKAGFERFWPLVSSRLLQGLIFAGVGFLVFYLAMAIFMVSPLSNRMMKELAPLAADPSFTPEMVLSDPEMMSKMFDAIMPMTILYGLLYIPILLAFSYRYRMTDYILIDQPGCSGFQALRQSRVMMRGNAMQLFKVDLSFWWYYLLRVLSTLLLYLDMILDMFGIMPDVPFEVSFLGTAVLYLAADFAINYFFLNKVSVTQALAYSSLVPKEQNDGGVVLGNIFQM